MEATQTAAAYAAQVYPVSIDLPCEACRAPAATHYASFGRPANFVGYAAETLFVCERCAEAIRRGEPLREGSQYAGN